MQDQIEYNFEWVHPSLITVGNIIIHNGAPTIVTRVEHEGLPGSNDYNSNIYIEDGEQYVDNDQELFLRLNS